VALSRKLTWKVIKQVHKLVNNENTDDKFLVFGDGATPLISVAQVHVRVCECVQLGKREQKERECVRGCARV